MDPVSPKNNEIIIGPDTDAEIDLALATSQVSSAAVSNLSSEDVSSQQEFQTLTGKFLEQSNQLSKNELLGMLGRIASLCDADLKKNIDQSLGISSALQRVELELTLSECRLAANLCANLGMKSAVSDRLQDRVIESIGQESPEQSLSDLNNLVMHGWLNQSQKDRLVERFIPIIPEINIETFVRAVEQKNFAKLQNLKLAKAVATQITRLAPEVSDGIFALALYGLREQARLMGLLNTGYSAAPIKIEQEAENNNLLFVVSPKQRAGFEKEICERIDRVVNDSTLSVEQKDQSWQSLILATKILGELEWYNPFLMKGVFHKVIEHRPEATGTDYLLLLSAIARKSDVRGSDTNLMSDRLGNAVRSSESATVMGLVTNLNRLSIFSSNFTEGLALLPEEQFSQIPPNKACMMLKSISNLNEYNPKLFSRFENYFIKSTLRISDLSKALSAFANLRYKPESLLAEKDDLITQSLLLGNLNWGQFAGIFRSLAVLDQERANKFWSNYLIARELKKEEVNLAPQQNQSNDKLNVNNIDSSSLFLVYHPLIVLNLEVPEAIAQKVNLLNGYEGQAAPSPSEFEQSVAPRLKSIGIDATPQVWFEGLYIDFLIKHKELLIALEFDGDNYHNVNGQLNGKTWLHTKFLENRGFIVVRIGSVEWRRENEAGKRDILKKALNCYLH